MKGDVFKLARLAVVICLGAISLKAAYAQEAIQDEEGWNFRVGIPLWASGAKGTVGVGNREVHVDDSFADLLDTLDFAAALNVEVRKSRWLFFSDGEYTKTSTSGQPRGLFGGTLAQVELSQKAAFNDLAVGYAVVKQERVSLELFAGAQLAYVESKLSLDLPIRNRTASTSKFWADPIIGFYLNYRFSKPAGLYLKTDVGGFGVASRVIWQAEGGFDFPIARRFYLRLAYRYLSTDYERDLFYNVAISGPQMEFGIRF